MSSYNRFIKSKIHPSYRSVLFVGHCYYNSWFLSKALKNLDWHSKIINVDLDPGNQHYYWGHDSQLPESLIEKFDLYLDSVINFKFFHFSNRGGLFFLNSNFVANKTERAFKVIIFLTIWVGLRISPDTINIFFLLKIRSFLTPYLEGSRSKEKFNRVFLLFIRGFPWHWDIYLLKAFGKKIVYSNNGCHDGVTPATFSKWGPYNVCKSLCPWFNTSVCTELDAINWGRFRNRVADYQILHGGNRADFNLVDTAHEVPEFYCLDSEIWKPGIDIIEKYKLNFDADVVKIYHSVGNFDSRTKHGVNIKCSHIYFPLIEELKKEGCKVELVFCQNVPNQEVRFVMAQCDLVVDMLTYGWFGANVREAMMLGIPSICYIRPEWLADVGKEIPEYAQNLPVISCDPTNIKSKLLEMIRDVELRKKIGRESREFAIKWHSKEAGAQRLSKIYSSLISN